MSDTILISVIIPVKNGSVTLEAALRGIFAQTLADRIEIIIIDSGSTDGTQDLIRKYPVRVQQIQPEEFNHGTTRNLGVELARGEFVVMTVQDATPASDHWLEMMLGHFDDPMVAGVCGIQITPHDLDKNPMQWHRPCSEPVPKTLYFDNAADFEMLPREKKITLCGWDDVTAMYRRSVLLSIPFRPVMFAEDWVWAHDALAGGFALVHDPRAMVCHYHHQTFVFRFRRQLTIYFHQNFYWGVMIKPDCWWRKIGQFTWHLTKQGPLRTDRNWYWIRYNLLLIVAEQLAYLSCKFFLVFGSGALDRFHGFFCKTPPMAVIRQR